MIEKRIGNICLKLNNEEIYEEEISVSVLEENYWNIWEKAGKGIYLGIDIAHKKCIITTVPNSGIHIYHRGNKIYDKIEDIEGKTLNENVIHRFLAYGYLVAPQTFYCGVTCLPGGHAILADTDTGKIKYVAAHFDTMNHREHTLEHSIKICDDDKISLTKENAYLALSGGLDSAVLLHEVQKRNKEVGLFSVYVNGGRDESYYQDILCEKSDFLHTKLEMTEEDAFEAFQIHSRRQEIFGFPIILKYEFMLKKAAELGCKYFITGDGPDELFVCEDTYETYLDHKNGLLKPTYEDIFEKEKSIILPQFSSQKSINIWAWYNIVFQSNTNVRFLYNIANANNICLLESYLNLSMYAYCIEYVEKLQKMTEKQCLKEYALDKIPLEIINRKKMGYTSDFSLWLKNGELFKEFIYKEMKDNNIPEILKPYKDIVCTLLEKEQGKDYDSTVRTGGTRKSSLVFCYLLLLNWMKFNND